MGCGRKLPASGTFPETAGPEGAGEGDAHWAKNSRRTREELFTVHILRCEEDRCASEDQNSQRGKEGTLHSRSGRGRGEPGAWGPKGPQRQVPSLPLPRLLKISTFGVSLGPSLMVPRLPRAKDSYNRFCSPDWACLKEDFVREACPHSKPRLVRLSWWSIRGSHTLASHIS